MESMGNEPQYEGSLFSLDQNVLQVRILYLVDVVPRQLLSKEVLGPRLLKDLRELFIQGDYKSDDVSHFGDTDFNSPTHLSRVTKRVRKPKDITTRTKVLFVKPLTIQKLTT